MSAVSNAKIIIHVLMSFNSLFCVEVILMPQLAGYSLYRFTSHLTASWELHGSVVQKEEFFTAIEYIRYVRKTKN